MKGPPTHAESALAQAPFNRTLVFIVMPEYELFYFPITGLGEPIRLAFALGGIPFKDTTPATDETFNDRKAGREPTPSTGSVFLEGTVFRSVAQREGQQKHKC